MARPEVEDLAEAEPGPALRALKLLQVEDLGELAQRHLVALDEGLARGELRVLDEVLAALAARAR